jgi:hypothetical protein
MNADAAVDVVRREALWFESGGFGKLLLDLLTPDEESVDERRRLTIRSPSTTR